MNATLSHRPDRGARELKAKLKRIAAMLTRMALKFDAIAESSVDDALAIDYVHQHRDAAMSPSQFNIGDILKRMLAFAVACAVD
ncbi:hypothetical protein [Novipirellula artificiosorum]|uniref:Uncharacterized protein n=1 Tax=Novipirellula artificiosorum TaxID=2528016 RepID=A0A5C6DQM5_9BACT|nr:hypothetical protein [Novipirellula artificiosorum]TWU39573.1 hypothetical protein Poly41_24280 [Novipirellula artificiosorum]